MSKFFPNFDIKSTIFFRTLARGLFPKLLDKALLCFKSIGTDGVISESCKKRDNFTYNYRKMTTLWMGVSAFSSNFGKRPLAKIGKNDRLNSKIGRN